MTQCSNWYHALTVNSKYQPRIKEILNSYFIGLALKFVIPGGHATFGKIYFVENSKKATFFSVAIEVFFQGWGNLFYASIASLFYFTEISLLLRVSLTGLIILSPLLLIMIVHIIPKYKEYSGTLQRIFPRIIISQLFFIPLTMVQYWLILVAFSGITFFHSSISAALILAANVIPITFAGLGLREYFAINVLAKYGITETAAVTTALVIFIINTLVPAIFGAILIVLHKKRTKKKSEASE